VIIKKEIASADIMVAGGMKCVKCLLFLFNLLFFIAGVVLIIGGTLIQTKYNADFAFFDNHAVNYVAVVLIGIGLIIFTIGFFGCCGAYRENYCLILTFAVLLGFVFVLEIAAAITAHLMRGKIDRLIRDTMLHSSKNYPGGKVVKEAWDHIQEDFDCCGARNYTDWASNANLNQSVPDSCCVVYQEYCGEGYFRHATTPEIYTEGCAEKFLIASDVTVIVVIVVAIAVAILQVLGIVLACFLASSVRHGYQPIKD